VDEVTRGWRNLQNEKPHNFYSSRNIIRIMKSLKLRWAGHVAHEGEEKLHTKFWLDRMKEGDYSED
jgi:hypothetical protein